MFIMIANYFEYDLYSDILGNFLKLKPKLLLDNGADLHLDKMCIRDSHMPSRTPEALMSIL